MTLPSLCRTILFLPLAAALFASAEAKTLQLYILTGQSNSLGAVKGSPASSALLDQYKSNGSTRFWHNNFNKDSGNSVDYQPPASSSWGAVTPQICGTGSSHYNCMGPEYGFAAMMERKGWSLEGTASGDADMGIVKTSLDGGGYSYWNKGTKAYNTIINTIREACENALANGYDNVEIMGVMYLQGESNANDNNIANSFLTFLDNLQADISRDGVDTARLASHQAILGEQALWNTTNVTNKATGDVTGGFNGNEGKAGTTRDQQHALAQENDNMGWVPTRDLAKITSGDSMGVHYDGKSQITIGARYAYEAAKLAGYDVGTVRSGNYDAALASTDAWMNGRLPSASVAVWDAASSAKDNMVSSSAGINASLYGIRIEDTYLNTITIRGVAVDGSASPSLEDGHLILGSGGIDIAAGRNLDIDAVLELQGNQTWNIAGGSSLTIQGSGAGTGSAGNHVLSFITGTGDVTIRNSTLDADPSGIARVNANTYINTTAAAFTGNWTIGAGVEITMNGKDSQTAASGWGSGSITLQGATVLAGWENVTANAWKNHFMLEEGTVSSFGSSSNASGKTLTLSGEISGKGALSKITANTLVLSHANTYEGGTHIQGGTVKIGNKEALGTGTAAVYAGGTLDLNHLDVNNVLRLSGGTVLNWGTSAQVEIAQHVIWADQNLSDTFTLADGSRILSDNSMTLGTGDHLAAGMFTLELSSRNLVDGGDGLAAIIMTGGTLNLLNGLTLDISGIVNRTGSMSFKIADISGGTLEGLSSAEDFSMADASNGWNILDYDASTGIVTLSVPEPSSSLLGLLGIMALLAKRRRN